MLRIGINGIGRIGRAILRSNLRKQNFKVVAVNDINPDNANIAYALNYDTLYGTLSDKFVSDGDYLMNLTEKFRVFHEHKVDNSDWRSENIDIVIDATGIYDNVLRARSALERNGLKKVVITHSPDPVDFTLVLGANENEFDADKHDVIASSICDATAMAPVMKAVSDVFGIEKGSVTTLHPWLNYQNLMDGPASSWSVPGEIYHHYALGRSVVGNMIPKPTSAMNATCKIVKAINEEMIGAFSYRTPTAVVASSDMSLILKKNTTKREVVHLLESIQQEQKWDIIQNNIDPLVSLDFKQSEFSAIVDHRWTNVIQGNLLKLVLWYDNEWGYSTRVVDQIGFISDQLLVLSEKGESHAAR